ncbi:hypothetical protein R5R35_005592 [Gryllus longicercus]|uniref:Uncharacterized protein n=1 Tax=Gryllus longicercus TaxID=2509291 RepID=A0AAN9VAD0_9ORTH
MFVVKLVSEARDRPKNWPVRAAKRRQGLTNSPRYTDRQLLVRAPLRNNFHKGVRLQLAADLPRSFSFVFKLDTSDVRGCVCKWNTRNLAALQFEALKL